MSNANAELYRLNCELSHKLDSLQNYISILHTKVCAIIDIFVSATIPIASRNEVAKTCLFSILGELDNIKKSYEQKNR